VLLLELNTPWQSTTVDVSIRGVKNSWGEAANCVTEIQEDGMLVDKKSLGAIGHPGTHGNYVANPIHLHGFGAWVGSYQHALAFTMCTHARLSSQASTPNSQNGKDSGCIGGGCQKIWYARLCRRVACTHTA